MTNKQARLLRIVGALRRNDRFDSDRAKKIRRDVEEAIYPELDDRLVSLIEGALRKNRFCDPERAAASVSDAVYETIRAVLMEEVAGAESSPKYQQKLNNTISHFPAQFLICSEDGKPQLCRICPINSFVDGNDEVNLTVLIKEGRSWRPLIEGISPDGLQALLALSADSVLRSGAFVAGV